MSDKGEQVTADEDAKSLNKREPSTTDNGPFQAVEPFLNWIQGVEIHFITRDVTNDDNKLFITGTLLDETNLLSLYRKKANSYKGKPWIYFKARLFDYTLPASWHDDLKEKLLHLTMADSESFITYSNQARTLQSLYNFDKVLMSDHDLAELYGMPRNLKAKVKEWKWQVLDAPNFKYGFFEQRWTLPTSNTDSSNNAVESSTTTSPNAGF
ncbi:hypothetical protein PTTG_28181 [Puccinia triticina 1-1 BBBD Race 1]|uniref:Uncharacterized protein n=1 Tax=Puccinia triticina (isolate 1-1 / race 1 (BBBD)) TaxID=630390 RepID=A0A180GE76_PUCT1|nr:hypothetical protein PTTG_28181 [Puccinia triticina 1-1 BBBD Race 1]